MSGAVRTVPIQEATFEPLRIAVKFAHNRDDRDLEQGLKLLRRAMRLNPYHPDWYRESYGEILYMRRDYAAAVDAFNRMSHKAPWTHYYLAACYAQLGRDAEAQKEVQSFRDVAKEGYSDQDYIGMDLLVHGDPSIKDHWLEGFRKAGLEV